MKELKNIIICQYCKNIYNKDNINVHLKYCDKYKFYINKTDIDKIQTGTLSEINRSRFENKIIDYKLITSDGYTISNSVITHRVTGSFECWKTGAILFLDETNPPTGGKKRRYTRKQRKSRKSNRRVKSYKRRK